MNNDTGLQNVVLLKVSPISVVLMSGVLQNVISLAVILNVILKSLIMLNVSRWRCAEYKMYLYWILLC